MRRILAIALLCLFCLAPALAQLGTLPYSGAGGGGGGAITITYEAAPAIQSLGTPTTTFSSVSLGSASPGRIIVVCATAAAMNSSTDTMTATEAGNAMTSARQQTRASGGSEFQGLFYIVDATNTTATITVTSTQGTMAHIGIAVWQISGSATPAPNTTAVDAYNYNADPQTTSSALTVLSNGGSIACGGSETFVVSPSWTVPSSTRDFSITDSSAWMMSGSHGSGTGSVTPSVGSISGGGWGMVGGSWGP